MHWKLCKVPFFFPVVTAHRDSQPMTKQSWWSTTQPWLLKSSHFSSLELWLGKKESYTALRISLGLLKDNIGGIKRKKGGPVLPSTFSLSHCALLAVKRLWVSKEKKWTYVPSFSKSVIVAGCSPAEGEREGSEREKDWEWVPNELQ